MFVCHRIIPPTVWSKNLCTNWSAVCVKQSMVVRVVVGSTQGRGSISDPCNTDGAMGAHYKNHHPN